MRSWLVFNDPRPPYGGAPRAIEITLATDEGMKAAIVVTGNDDLDPLLAESEVAWWWENGTLLEHDAVVATWLTQGKE